jgi:hypothetical protein
VNIIAAIMIYGNCLNFPSPTAHCQLPTVHYLLC